DEHVSLVLIPEVGYSYDHLGTHLFTLSPGVGVGEQRWSVVYHPRLLVGEAATGRVIGVRNGVAVHALFDIYSLEVAHEVLFGNGSTQEDVRVVLGLNPLGALRFMPVFRGIGWMFGHAPL